MVQGFRIAWKLKLYMHEIAVC